MILLDSNHPRDNVSTMEKHTLFTYLMYLLKKVKFFLILMHFSQESTDRCYVPNKTEREEKDSSDKRGSDASNVREEVEDSNEDETSVGNSTEAIGMILFCLLVVRL